MRKGPIDTKDLTSEEYWEIFGSLITSADLGTVLATTGWLFFWFDRIPQHIFHTHVLTVIFFFTGLLAGLYGAWLMIRTGNRMGTKADRRLHILMVCYAVTSSATGILAYILFPVH